jgi:hypothetical protein
MDSKKNISQYIVYELKDPRDGVVFYVGKGCSSRPYAHAKEAMKGVLSDKCDKIRDILASGNSVCVSVVKTFERESDAYRLEHERINEIGLHKLTNISPGTPNMACIEAAHVLSDVNYAVLAKCMALRNAGVRINYLGWDLLDGAMIAMGAVIDSIGFDKVKEGLSKHRIELVACNG